MTHQSGRTYRVAIGIAAATMLAATLTACGGDSTELPPPPASPPAAAPTATSNLDPADAEAAEEILAAFDSYMEGLVELSTEGVYGGTEETLERLEEIHVSGEAYDELAFGLLTPNAREGHATAGTLAWETEVTEIDWEHRFEFRPEDVVPLARIRACIDETNWTTIEVETGNVVDGPGTRYASDVMVTWRGDDEDRPDREPRWQVSFRTDGDDPC